MIFMKTRLWVPLLAALSGRTLASAGDRAQEFQACVTSRTTTQCNSSNSVNLSAPLRVTQWSCVDDCKYFCMHDITTRNIAAGEPVLQYFGKWPFWRFFGMQEPASVAFSLLNLWFHVKGLSTWRRTIPNSHPLKMYYLIWSITSINTWVWSAVFHTRGQLSSNY